jgi:hypothetical protein
MRVLVDGFIGAGAGVAKVRGNIHAMYSVAGILGRAEQPVDNGRRHAVRRRREQRTARCFSHQRVDLIETAESQVRIGAAQMRKGSGHRTARLAVGQNGGGVQARMPRDQAQQLAGHVAGAAQNDGGNGIAHAPTTLDSRAFAMPSFAMR